MSAPPAVDKHKALWVPVHRDLKAILDARRPQEPVHRAEAGCDARTIADMLGQKTTPMAERQANRRHLVRAAGKLDLRN